MSDTISQAPVRLTLEWFEGDAVSLAWTVTGVNWSGTYTGTVHLTDGSSVALTVTATVDGADTDFTATMSAQLSAGVSAGQHLWTAKVSGLTRFAGPVNVLAR